MKPFEPYHPDPEIAAGVAADTLAAEIEDLAAGYLPRRWQCECGAEHGRGHFYTIGTHRCFHCGYVGDGGVMIGPDMSAMSLGRSSRSSSQPEQSYRDGVPGFYIVDLAAQVVVAGPYKLMGTAEYQAALREPPSMIVVEVDRG